MRRPSASGGRAAGALLAGTVLLFLVLQLMRVAGQGPGDDFSDNVPWSITVLLFFLAGFAALIAGAWSLVRSRERTVLGAMPKCCGSPVEIR